MGEAPLDTFERDKRIVLELLREIEDKLSSLESKIESLQGTADEIESILSRNESSNP